MDKKKLFIVGSLKVGKSSIIKRFDEDTYTDNYEPTIGIDFLTKVVNWEPMNREVKLELWDLTFQERFNSMIKPYYIRSNGGLMVVDITNLNSFEIVKSIKSDIDSVSKVLPSNRSAPIVLLVTKWDEEGRKIGFVKTEDQINDFCAEHGFIRWFQTSAKDNLNIEASFKFLFRYIVENNIEPVPHETPWILA
eukprot:gene3159-3956_t